MIRVFLFCAGVIVETLWRINIVKYDRRLHITMPVYLARDEGDRLWFKGQMGGLIDHRTRGKLWAIEKPFDLVFWRDRWYNVFVNRHSDGTLNHFYCNVALPPTINDHTLTFVDLDLDVRIRPGQPPDILDEDEFIEHTALFAYPDEVQRGARQAVEDLLALWQARQSPFDIAPE